MRLRLDRRQLVLLGGAAISLGVAAWVISLALAPGAGLIGGDFRVFYAAARLLAAAGNPYSGAHLNAYAQSIWPAPGIRAVFVNPPAAAILFLPLLNLSFWAAYATFTGLGVGAVLLTAGHLLRAMGWRQPLVLCLAVLVSWIGLSGLMLGQFDALLLAALLGSLILVRRRSYVGAGMLMGAAWLKPDLMWPAALLLAVALWPSRRAVVGYAGGLLLSSVALLLPAGWLLLPWLRSLLSFGSHLSSQTALAGLGGWAEAMGGGRLLGATAATWLMAAAAAVAGLGLLWLGRDLLRPRARGESLAWRADWAVALSLGLWLWLTPYAHSNDDLLLLPLLVLVVGRDASRAGSLLPGASILALAALAVVQQFVLLPVSAMPLAVGLLLWSGLRTYRQARGPSHPGPEPGYAGAAAQIGPLAVVQGRPQ